jgi:hypothetical protein
MLTAIPTTHYVLHRMMEERGHWIGEPQIVVNMNVSWARYAPLWILERLPEVFDRAEALGADPAEIDHWRVHNLPGIIHYFKAIMADDPAGNRVYFAPARLIARFKHLPEFKSEVQGLRRTYEAARARGVEGTELPTQEVFAAFEERN